MEIWNDYNVSVAKALEEIDENWEEYYGLIICGTHSPKNWEKQIERIKDARETGRPFLGICFGYQLACIQWARENGIPDATSQEFGVNGRYVVIKLPELKVGLHDGESYWHNYAPIKLDYEFPSNFITTQAHPEYQSTKEKPHPVLVEFIKLCQKK